MPTERSPKLDWRSLLAKQRKPEEQARLAEEMTASSGRIFTHFYEIGDAELSATLLKLLKQNLAIGYYQGFRRGYLVRAELASRGEKSKRIAAETKIADLCQKQPDWTARQIFSAMDEQDVPLILRGSVHMRKKRKWKPKYWMDVADDPAYKQYVHRIKIKLKRHAYALQWESIMKEHSKLRAIRKSSNEERGEISG